tara:strand:- start:7968 stop:8399 length:432 start_codon:yes stop_codon:yes gene_type:complete
MQQLFEAWRIYESTNITVDTRDDIIKLINKNPNYNIHLDKPKGTFKSFGRPTKVKMPFDYGEYPDLINPADNMGWDVVIVPSATKDDSNLKPAGYLAYKDGSGKEGNDKIILAPFGTRYTEEDKELITSFFAELEKFEPATWF